MTLSATSHNVQNARVLRCLQGEVASGWRLPPFVIATIAIPARLCRPPARLCRPPLPTRARRPPLSLLLIHPRRSPTCHCAATRSLSSSSNPPLCRRTRRHSPLISDAATIAAVAVVTASLSAGTHLSQVEWSRVEWSRVSQVKSSRVRTCRRSPLWSDAATIASVAVVTAALGAVQWSPVQSRPVPSSPVQSRPVPSSQAAFTVATAAAQSRCRRRRSRLSLSLLPFTVGMLAVHYRSEDLYCPAGTRDIVIGPTTATLTDSLTCTDATRLELEPRFKSQSPPF